MWSHRPCELGAWLPSFRGTPSALAPRNNLCALSSIVFLFWVAEWLILCKSSLTLAWVLTTKSGWERHFLVFFFFPLWKEPWSDVHPLCLRSGLPFTFQETKFVVMLIGHSLPTNCTVMITMKGPMALPCWDEGHINSNFSRTSLSKWVEISGLSLLKWKERGICYLWSHEYGFSYL